MRHPRATFVATAALAFAVFGLGSVSCQKKEKAPDAAAAQDRIAATVQAIKPQIKNVPIFKEWVAKLNGKVNATILPQVSGYLIEQVYQNGQYVKKGDVLFRIDPRTFKAALEQAEGDLARARASLTKNQMDVERYTPLVEVKAVSQKQLDDAIQATKESQAAVEIAQAAVDKAKLDLGFTTVISPIDGIVGIAQAQIGDLVSPNGMVLTQVSSVDPIRVDFAITEQDWLSTIMGAMKKGGMDTMPGVTQNMEVILANGETYDRTARSVAVNREVNANTGSINIEAEVDNPIKMLRPGMFVRVRAQIDEIKDAMVVPTLSIVAQQGAYFVVTVDAQGAPAIVPVKPGVISGHEQVVTPIFEGTLTPDKDVVVVGTYQAMMVAPRNPGEHASARVKVVPYVPAPTKALSPAGAGKPADDKKGGEEKGATALSVLPANLIG